MAKFKRGHKLPIKAHFTRRNTTKGRGRFHAQVCIGSFTGGVSTPTSTTLKSRCGNGYGKNPREALAKALRSAARVATGRGGSFAGVKK